MSKSKSRTKWYYTDKGDQGTFIRVGFVRNSDGLTGNKYAHDCIRLQIRSAWEGEEDTDFCVRLDEAASIASGLALIAAKIASGACGKLNLKNHSKAVQENSL
jgi:hypothetical protein